MFGNWSPIIATSFSATFRLVSYQNLVVYYHSRWKKSQIATKFYFWSNIFPTVWWLCDGSLTILMTLWQFSNNSDDSDNWRLWLPDSKIFIHVWIERLRCKQVRNIVHLHQWAHPYNNTSWLVIVQKFHLISYRINGTSMTALGFQLHFTDVYLEELAKASEISKTKSEKRYAWNSFIFNRLYTLYKAVYVPGTYRT